MTIKLGMVAAATTAAMLGTATASAATVTLNKTLDLSKPAYLDHGLTTWFNNADESIIPIPDGDTLIATVNFRGTDPRPQELTVTNLSVFFPYFHQLACMDPPGCHILSADQSPVWQMGKVEFLDGNGDVVASSTTISSLEGLPEVVDGLLWHDHYGQYFEDSALPDGTFTFSGFRYIGLVTGYSAPKSVLFAAQNAAWMHLAADAYSVKTFEPAPGSVPEPQAWAIMILGFGLAGAALRIRRPKFA